MYSELNTLHTLFRTSSSNHARRAFSTGAQFRNLLKERGWEGAREGEDIKVEVIQQGNWLQTGYPFFN